ncbi:hypothetical protein ACLKA7_009932 [Drosophila subpalustris]
MYEPSTYPHHTIFSKCRSLTKPKGEPTPTDTIRYVRNLQAVNFHTCGREMPAIIGSPQSDQVQLQDTDFPPKNLVGANCPDVTVFPFAVSLVSVNFKRCVRKIQRNVTLEATTAIT